MDLKTIRRAAALSLLLAFPLHAAGPEAGSVAIFAGGCFWCTEADFEKVPGVLSAESGYIGGRTERPTYEQVAAGGSGHAEAVRIRFDPARVSYERLLEYYWHSIDPFTANAQFCDHGDAYRPAIFYRSDAQKAAALRSRDALQALREKRIVTEIVAAGTFWPAEDDHQDYYRKNPLRYRYYRHGCGRDAALDRIWGKDRLKAGG